MKCIYCKWRFISIFVITRLIGIHIHHGWYLLVIYKCPLSFLQQNITINVPFLRYYASLFSQKNSFVFEVHQISKKWIKTLLVIFCNLFTPIFLYAQMTFIGLHLTMVHNLNNGRTTHGNTNDQKLTVVR